MEWGARLSRSLARCVIKRGKKFISIYSHFANFSEVGSTVGTPLIYMWRSWVTTDRSVMSHDHMLFALLMVLVDSGRCYEGDHFVHGRAVSRHVILARLTHLCWCWNRL